MKIQRILGIVNIFHIMRKSCIWLDEFCVLKIIAVIQRIKRMEN